ncbi:MAG TPA: hypothetical protein VG295_12100 [Solirubrobacteraceae bacterium]|nr:hypothetical protein [Solirubrobacteraceae bacterium]
MARVQNLRPGYKVTYPNRDKPASKVTKLIVVVLLLVSVALMAIVTVGGWSELEGEQPLNFFFILSYLIFAFYIARWQRGLLPMAAALGIVLLILAVIASTGASGTSWFDRNHPGFAPPQSLFGGNGLSPDTLGVTTVLMIPVEALLIVFSMLGFSQGWNVEVEIPAGSSPRPGGSPSAPAPAAA